MNVIRGVIRMMEIQHGVYEVTQLLIKAKGGN